MRAEPGGGVFVYHPLHSNTPLYSLYEQALRPGSSPVARQLSPDDESRLISRYLLHMGDVAGRRGMDRTSIPSSAGFKEDSRPLVQHFRAFFPELGSQTTLTDTAVKVAVFFPSLECFDTRCIEIKGHHEAIFVTSRTLDAIELFADTLSLCIRLNGMEMSRMLSLEDPMPPHILLAWMTMCARGEPDVFMLDSILGPSSRGKNEKALHAEIYATGRALGALGEEYRQGWGNYRLSMATSSLMLLAINHLVRGANQAAQGFVGATRRLPSSSSLMSMDSSYFATLILSFIVLHEIGHFALGHNKAAGSPENPQLVNLAESVVAQAEKSGDTAQNLIGTFVGHETAADGFALDVIDEQYRDPMLEAATLWCAALSGTNGDCGNWLQNFPAHALEQYPAFSMRVWFLNGKFSSGKRQGEIAKAITAQTEALARVNHEEESLTPDSARLFRNLWNIAAAQSLLL
jgi:hypothetical protein